MISKGFPLIIFSILTISFILGCTGTKVEGPGIVFSNDKYNFGTIEEGKPLNHTYEFRNNGNQNLIIEDVHPTCGCTVAGDYDKEIKPGQRGKIPISFKTSGYDGKATKTIVVKTNVPDKKELILSLEGIIYVPISVNPRDLFLGDIDSNRKEPLIGKISISNRLSDKIKISKIETSGLNVETKIETVKDGFEYILDITVRPPFKKGSVTEMIVLKTDSKEKPEINTQFSYYVKPLANVYPKELIVSMHDIANGVEKVINVQGKPDVNIEVVNLAVNNDKVKMTLKQIEKGMLYVITLKFAKDFTFDQNQELFVKFNVINGTDVSEFIIPVYNM